VIAAREVLARWETGDLAEATNRLSEAIDSVTDHARPIAEASLRQRYEAVGDSPCMATDILRDVLLAWCQCDDRDRGGACAFHSPTEAMPGGDAADSLLDLLQKAEQVVLGIGLHEAAVMGALGLMEMLYGVKTSKCEGSHIDNPATPGAPVTSPDDEEIAT